MECATVVEIDELSNHKWKCVVKQQNQSLRLLFEFLENSSSLLRDESLKVLCSEFFTV